MARFLGGAGVASLLSVIIPTYNRAAVLQTAIEWVDHPADLARVAREPLRFATWPDVFAFALARPLAGAGATVVRADLARACGGFSTTRIVGEDIDLLLKLGASGPFV